MVDIIGLIIFLAGVAELVVLYIMAKRSGSHELHLAYYKDVYSKYYDSKRKEFPWLDNWIKTHEDPTEKRASFMTTKAGNSLYPSLIALLILVVGGIVCLIVMRKSTAAFTIIGIITLALSFFGAGKPCREL